MLTEFEPVTEGLFNLLNEWEPKLHSLSQDVISNRRNSQHRSIKQITGHMVDSASNNTHRIVHLQYQESPFTFPNYATQGNNDRWIAIQHYQDENWNDLVELWNYSNLHIIHLIKQIKPEFLNQQWMASPDTNVTLKEMVIDYLPHFKLHLSEIEELINLE